MIECRNVIARPRRIMQAIAIGVLLVVVFALARAETPLPPAPSAWITDTDGLLAPQTVADVDARLRAYERNSSRQIIVYVTPTTGGASLEDWTARAFAHWKIGRKGLDDGVALFIFPRDRTVRIEVGYGLESAVPDALASRVVRETIVPELRAGNPDRAVTLGVERIVGLATASRSSGANAAGSTSDSDTTNALASRPLTPLELILIGLVIVVLVIFAIRSPTAALFLLVNIFGGRGRMSSEGGFSGGGGRSGGGGASGRW